MKNAVHHYKIPVTAILLMLGISCKEKSKDAPAAPMSNEMNQSDPSENSVSNSATDKANVSSTVIKEYLKLKDALVADDEEGAAKAGNMLETEASNLDVSPLPEDKQERATALASEVKMHAGMIAQSGIKEQREEFDKLSGTMIDFVAVTGSSRKLYQNLCPMYNDNAGAQWLSASEEIKNPYYGKEMMNCGTVQKTIEKTD